MMVQVIVLDAFDKVNDNFNELYGAGAAGTNVDIQAIRYYNQTQTVT